MPQAGKPPGLEVHPLSPDRWHDFVALFGKRGACGGCWCMFWRQTATEFQKKKGTANKNAMKKLVESGACPGLLAYIDDQPAGWCAIAPRGQFSRLERSRVCRPIDDQPVWSVVCFFIAKPYRNRGLTVHLLKAAVEYARSRGATIVEGYPVDPLGGEYVDTFAYTGLFSAFKRAGFREAARRTEKRPIMRFIIR